MHLAVALTKNMERYEWMLEKATEIGVDEITPLLCEYSERRTWKRERAEKIIVAAMKQSHQAYLPKLNEPCEFISFTQQFFEGKKLIAHCGVGEKLAITAALQHVERALIAIGPEGDFSLNEINTAVEKGYSAITFGENRLRAETAGIVACTAMSIINL